MYERTYGEQAKATAELTTVEVAKRIRQDIKGRIKSKVFPKGLKVSVRSAGFSGGTSIDLYITGLPKEVKLFNPSYDASCRNSLKQYTTKVRRILAVLKRIHGTYNYDGSEIMTDYFDVRYYGSVGVHWEFAKDRQEVEGHKVERGGIVG